MLDIVIKLPAWIQTRHRVQRWFERMQHTVSLKIVSLSCNLAEMTTRYGTDGFNVVYNRWYYHSAHGMVCSTNDIWLLPCIYLKCPNLEKPKNEIYYKKLCGCRRTTRRTINTNYRLLWKCLQYGNILQGHLRSLQLLLHVLDRPYTIITSC